MSDAFAIDYYRYFRVDSVYKSALYKSDRPAFPSRATVPTLSRSTGRSKGATRSRPQFLTLEFVHRITLRFDVKQLDFT